MLLTFLSLFLSAVVLWFLHDRQKNPKRPPGPFRYPLLGNLAQIAAADPFGFRAYHKLAQQHGEVMSMKVGLQEMVVLSSYETMKDLLGRDELNGRLWTGFLVDRSMGKNLGIAFNSGDKQQILKQFTIKTLGDFGFGKRESMESIIGVELEEMMGRLEKVAEGEGKVVMERFFQLSLLNVLWSMLAGVRYSHDDPKLLKLLQVNSMWFQSGNFGAGIVTAYPFLRHLFPEWTGYNEQKRGNKIIHGFLREMIKEHREQDGFDTDPQCFIDVFLAKISLEFGNDQTAFTDEQFMVTCYDMFQAGFETTSNTLAFGILFMVLNPYEQEKIQRELDTVLTKGSIASMNDRERLTYTRAAVLEVFRLSNILPISGPRLVMGDIHYKRYWEKRGNYMLWIVWILQETAVVFNTYSVMRDEKVWGDPNVFRPARFLDAEGNLNEMIKYMSVGFGIGKRSCLGEVLAQTTVFMYFTTLLRNFRFEACSRQPPPTTEPIFGIILSPHPYKVVVKSRQ